jgi:hypothetical protein
MLKNPKKEPKQVYKDYKREVRNVSSELKLDEENGMCGKCLKKFE